MNLKKIMLAVLLVSVMACSLCACQQSDNSKESKTDSKLSNLKIGIDDLKPFFYVDENGDYAGIDADIAKEACKRAGYRPEFVKVKWSERNTGLDAGTIDCIWNAFVKNGREDSYLWSETYMRSNLRIITAAPQKSDKNIKNSKKKKEDKHAKNTEKSDLKAGVAIRAGSKMQELIQKNNKKNAPSNIYICGSFEKAETAFVKGYAASLGGHEAALQEVLNTYPGQYHFQDGSLMTADLAVAFKKDSASDKYLKINDALKSMKNDGTIKAILEKYKANLTTTEGAVNDED